MKTSTLIGQSQRDKETGEPCAMKVASTVRRGTGRKGSNDLARGLPYHISVCIYDPPVASNYVVISGTATCNDQDIWDEARRIIARYRAPDEVDDYVARWKTEPRVLITVTPEHIATRAPR